MSHTEGMTVQEQLLRQQQEHAHHGDSAIPPEQRFGGFALSLMAGLGMRIRNRFGLRPAPFQLSSTDRQGVLTGVAALNAHPHLPHLNALGTALNVSRCSFAGASIQPLHPIRLRSRVGTILTVCCKQCPACSVARSSWRMPPSGIPTQVRSRTSRGSGALWRQSSEGECGERITGARDRRPWRPLRPALRRRAAEKSAWCGT
jgi:hypothetical protein